MPTVLEGIGIEQLIDTVEFKLREQLAGALELQAERWEALDQARADARGEVYEEITLQPPDAHSYYAFSLPSLVRNDLPLNDFPYVAIIPDDSTPSAEDASMDQLNVRQNMVSIHAIAKSSKSEGAEFAGRRAARMAEAIYAVASTDRDLRHMLQGISNPMRIRVSEPFIFNPEGLEDQDWYWQAAGSQYSVKNIVKPPKEVLN